MSVVLLWSADRLSGPPTPAGESAGRPVAEFGDRFSPAAAEGGSEQLDGGER